MLDQLKIDMCIKAFWQSNRDDAYEKSGNAFATLVARLEELFLKLEEEELGFPWLKM